METRSAREYADFVLPSIRPGDRVLDVGCGPGSISVGMAAVAASVTGVDLDDAEFAEAREYAKSKQITNVTFVEGSIYNLEFPDASFDVCTCFSMLEVVERPLEGLLDVSRVLKPGGVLAASSIEYGGLILEGPGEPLLRRFYDLRLQIYEAQGDVWPNRGRQLRGLLIGAGCTDVEATTTYFSYGTEERVRSFGLRQAADCREDWYVESLAKYGLADSAEIDELERAWLAWSESPDAFVAFAWGRATGRRPA
jgi:SAM-dependent methyltransferase